MENAQKIIKHQIERGSSATFIERNILDAPFPIDIEGLDC